MFPPICIKSNSVISAVINDRHSLSFLCFCGLTSFQVQQFTISLMSSHLLLSSPLLFVCSDQLTWIDVAAETIRWPPVKQRTGGWLACQQRCGHTALWRQRYELHCTRTGLEDLKKGKKSCNIWNFKWFIISYKAVTTKYPKKAILKNISVSNQ